MARTILLRGERGSYSVTVADDGTIRVDGSEPVRAAVTSAGTVRLGGTPWRTAWVAASADARWVFLDGHVYRFDVETPARTRAGRAHHGSLAAPMPATVIRVHVKPGDAVKRGDTLIILEAMKMELPVRASAAGIITEVRCREGELVQPGESLIEMDEEEV